MAEQITCVFILSEKSSGSSMLFRSLSQFLGIKRYPQSRHFEQETLFWTKAASVLNLPQKDMCASEVPIPTAKARMDLENFLSQNLQQDFSSYSDDALVFEGWYQLIQTFGPVFIEKSPHHLMQESVLALMQQFANRYPQVNVKYIGIIRNPYDTACSQFRRWQIPIEKIESQWQLAYSNLQKLNRQCGANVSILRYEDYLCSPKKLLEQMIEFIGIAHSGSMQKVELIKASKAAKTKSKFGFKLSAQTQDLATSYDYLKNELNPEPSALWPLYKLYMMYPRKYLKLSYEFFNKLKVQGQVT